MMLSKLVFMLWLSLLTHLVTSTITTNNNGYYIGVYDDTNVYNWYEAKDYCMKNFGSSLGSVHSAIDKINLENARVNTTISSWTGLNDIKNESTWAWTDGTTYDYNITWADGSPMSNNSDTNNCGQMYSDGKWNDAICGTKYLSQFICNLQVNWRAIYKINRNLSDFNETTKPAYFWANSSLSTFNNYNDDIDYILNSFDASKLESLSENNYRSLMIDDWNRLYTNGKFDKIKVSIYKDGEEVIYFIYNAINNFTSWYSQSHLIDSSYKDTIYSTYRAWAILPNANRNWIVWYQYGGCPVDSGWIAVSLTSACAVWSPSEGISLPEIRYSIAKSGNNDPIRGTMATSSQSAIGDTFVVFVNAENTTTFGLTDVPTQIPTTIPSINPTQDPSIRPTIHPSQGPTSVPSYNPSMNPSVYPTDNPSFNPTLYPTLSTNNPTLYPSVEPSIEPTVESFVPSMNPITTTMNSSTVEIEATSDKSSSNNNNNSTVDLEFIITIVGIVSGAVVIIVVFCSTLIYYDRKHKRELELNQRQQANFVEFSNVKSPSGLSIVSANNSNMNIDVNNDNSNNDNNNFSKQMTFSMTDHKHNNNKHNNNNNHNDDIDITEVAPLPMMATTSAVAVAVALGVPGVSRENLHDVSDDNNNDNDNVYLTDDGYDDVDIGGGEEEEEEGGKIIQGNTPIGTVNVDNIATIKHIPALAPPSLQAISNNSSNYAAGNDNSNNNNVNDSENEDMYDDGAAVDASDAIQRLETLTTPKGEADQD